MTCTYCGSTEGPFHRDHIVPRSRGGPDIAMNLAAACPTCNQAKGTMLASEWLGDKCPAHILKIEARINSRLAKEFAQRDVPKKSRDPLIGKFFHSYEGPLLQWQGMIVGRSDAGYLCQLYEWICGQASDQVLVSGEDMSAWRFYDDRESWLAAYERYDAKRSRLERGAI